MEHDQPVSWPVDPEPPTPKTRSRKAAPKAQRPPKDPEETAQTVEPVPEPQGVRLVSFSDGASAAIKTF